MNDLEINLTTTFLDPPFAGLYRIMIQEQVTTTSEKSDKRQY